MSLVACERLSYAYKTSLLRDMSPTFAPMVAECGELWLIQTAHEKEVKGLKIPMFHFNFDFD